jgi:hypothetical protein
MFTQCANIMLEEQHRVGLTKLKEICAIHPLYSALGLVVQQEKVTAQTWLTLLRRLPKRMQEQKWRSSL